MIDTNGNYQLDVDELTRREDGHTVTATITPSGTVTYAVDDGDGKRAIGEELAWDGVTCAALVERVKRLHALFLASEDLAIAVAGARHPDPLVGANPSVARVVAAQERYDAAKAALPLAVV